MLKKKFFFTDQNIDRNDPIQLNLLYEQSKKAILSGQHFCNIEDACMLAALQCQAQFGNNDPQKHKAGFLQIEEFLPSDYIKKKDIEKSIYNEHSKLKGMSELNAKFRYVKQCRSLKTYGVTFFQVREKNPKKNQLQTVLLGINREAVVKMDPATKDVIEYWPLKTLREWGATETS